MLQHDNVYTRYIKERWLTGTDPTSKHKSWVRYSTYFYRSRTGGWKLGRGGMVPGIVWLRLGGKCEGKGEWEEEDSLSCCAGLSERGVWEGTIAELVLEIEGEKEQQILSRLLLRLLFRVLDRINELDFWPLARGVAIPMFPERVSHKTMSS